MCPSCLAWCWGSGELRGAVGGAVFKVRRSASHFLRLESGLKESRGRSHAFHRQGLAAWAFQKLPCGEGRFKSSMAQTYLYIYIYCMYIYLSICLPLSACLPVSLSAWLSVCLSACQSVSQSVSQSAYLSIYLS